MRDKNIELQIIGCLMKHPQYLSEIDKYTLTPSDFSSTFQRYLFVAIDNLYRGGAAKITPVDISLYLESNAAGQQSFSQNNGIEYLQDAEYLAEEGNFPYYYKELKKMNLVNDLKRMGLDTSSIYCENLTAPNAFEINQHFKDLTIEDILTEVKKKVLKVEKDYIQSEVVQTWDLEDEVDSVVEEFGNTEGIGLPLNGEIRSSVINGAAAGALTIQSASSGCGKALPNSVKIPTLQGWKKVEEIQIGDYLFDALGRPTKVLGVFPQGQREVWQVTFKDGRFARCCGEHLWSYCTPGQKAESKKKRQFYTKKLEDLAKEPLQQGRGSFRILIPQQYAVEYEGKEHFLPPYIMGLALGDGSFRQHQSNKSFQFSSETEELPKFIAQTMGWLLKKSSDFNFTWYFAEKERQEKAKEKINIWVEDILKEHPELIDATSETKFIPRNYLEDSVENRYDLLNGLLDTDGTVDEKGRISYCTTSPFLKDNVIELCQSLGFKTSFLIDSRENRRPLYVIHITGRPTDKLKLFKMARKKAIIENWYNSKKRKENNEYNPIVKIEKLNYFEEMTCFLVDNNEHLFLTENFIVTHNTRLAVADACKLAFPFYFDERAGAWVKNGSTEPVLFIMTEQKPEQVIKMILAYLSGVDESKYRYGNLTKEEWKRIETAKAIIKHYKTLKLMRIPDPTITQLKLSIREEVILSERRHVFFDYIFISPGLIGEFRGSSLRNDELLLLMVTALKDLAIEQNISIFTSTQVNAKADDNSSIRNEASLAGGRSTINKADNGIIMARPTKDELEILAKDGVIREETPNRVFDVFKVRSGKWTQVRIWSYFNGGTLRLKDLFITDDRLNPIADFFGEEPKVDWELEDEDAKFLQKINS